jgi:hypothetical protein
MMPINVSAAGRSPRISPTATGIATAQTAVTGATIAIVPMARAR